MDINNQKQETENWLSIGEAAKYLRISRDTLRRWEKKGLIKSHRSPTNRRYYKKEELNYIFTKRPEIEEKLSEAKPESTAPPAKKESRLSLTIINLLTIYIILMIFLAFLLLRAS